MRRLTRGTISTIGIFILSILLINLIYFVVLVPFYVSASDVTTYDPSEVELNTWVNPELAYTSDDYYASATYDNVNGTWKGYGINLPQGTTIDYVKVGLEGKSFEPDIERLKVTIWNGSQWSSPVIVNHGSSETMIWTDFTSAFNWDASQCNQIKVHVHFDRATVGCFTNETYFVSWNESALEDPAKRVPYVMKRIDKAQVGDPILVWDQWEGVLKFSTVSMLNVHYGNWTVYDIWSGSVEIPLRGSEKFIWEHHGKASTGHPIDVLRDGEIIRTVVEDVKLSDFTPHISHDSKILKSGEWIPLDEHYVDWDPIERIDIYNMTGNVYDLKTQYAGECIFATTITDEELKILTDLVEIYGINLESYIDPTKILKWTTLLDWVPVKISYTLPSEEEVIDCNWIGTNTTIAGNPCLFSADLEDFNETYGLSHNLFSRNLTGSWQNSSWSDVWFDQNWTRWEDTLNSTENLVQAFRFFFNDTVGTEHASTFCYFSTVAEPTTREITPTFGAGAGTPIPYVEYVLRVLRGAMTTRDGYITIVTFGGLGFIIAMVLFRRRREPKDYRVSKVDRE